MRQLLKTTLILPLLLGALTPVLAAEDQAAPETNDTNPPIEAPATPPQDAPAAPRVGDTDGIGNATSGKTLPLTLKLSDLGDNWRQLTISPQLEANDKTTHDLNNTPDKPGTDPDADMQKLMALLASGPGVYFTQGQTVTTGDASFLVAYHARFDAQVFKKLFPDTKPNYPNNATEVSRVLEQYLRDRTLDLSLLNLRQVGTMSNIQPFSMDTQIANLRAFVVASYKITTTDLHVDASPAAITPSNDTPTEHDGNETAANDNAPREHTPPPAHGNETAANALYDSSVSRLRAIGVGLQNYLEDHDGMLPPLQDAAAAQAALKPYASETDFIHPGTKEAYLPNAILSGKKLAHITNPVAMVAFYEAHPAADGKRAILFLDGHVKRIKEAEWPLVKHASRVP